jgi:hypothetical protein
VIVARHTATDLTTKSYLFIFKKGIDFFVTYFLFFPTQININFTLQKRGKLGTFLSNTW